MTPDKKPGRLWFARKRVGAFVAACKDKDTRYLGRIAARDTVLSVASFATAGAFLNVSATAITSFILGYGLPIAAGAGVLMGAKSYLAYRKSTQGNSRRKSTHMRDGLLAVGAIAGAAFLLSTGAAATVAMVVGVGAPVAAGAGVLMGIKTWMDVKKINASMPAYRYMRDAQDQWDEKQKRAPLFKRIGAAIRNTLTAPLRLFKRTGGNDNTATEAPAITAQNNTSTLNSGASDDFATSAPKKVDPAREEAARKREEARLQRKEQRRDSHF